MPKNTYEVRVQRIEYQIAVVVVVADSEEEAEQLAYEEAKDFTVSNMSEEEVVEHASIGFWCVPTVLEEIETIVSN